MAGLDALGCFLYFSVLVAIRRGGRCFLGETCVQGWGFLRCWLSNSFHSGLGMSSWQSEGQAAWTSQLFFSVLPSNTHPVAVTPVAQPFLYRFQSLNISYGPEEPELESDLSRPGTKSAP